MYEKNKIIDVDLSIRDDEIVTISKVTYDNGAVTIKKTYNCSAYSSIIIDMLKDEKKYLEELRDTKLVPKLVNYEFSSYRNFLEIETKYIDGKTLLDMFYTKDYVIRKNVFNDKISYKRRFNYAIKIAKAIKEIHKHNIVHRDIKPNNIIIKNCKVYIIDFGISLKNGETPDVISGNNRYCPSRQKNRLVPCRFQDDLFALATMFIDDFKLDKWCYLKGYLDNYQRFTIDDLLKDLEKGYDRYCKSIA